jgi:hypothetical protein
MTKKKPEGQAAGGDARFHQDLDPDRPLPPELLDQIRRDVEKAGGDPAVVVR